MRCSFALVLSVVLAVGCGTDDGGGSPATEDAPDGQAATDAQDTLSDDTGESQGDACAPECGSKECGDDGCGGTCGECPQAAPVCSDDQLCEAECVAQCDGLECGDDGCGGTCGECPLEMPVCDADQKCIACVPDCANKGCGGDGCDATCGTCDDYASCEGTSLTSHSEGVCVEGDGEAVCEYSETVNDCAADGEVCASDQCTSTDPNDFVFGQASSVITKLDIMGAAAGETCCFDLDGDAEADNLLGALLTSWASLGGTDEPEVSPETGALLPLLNYDGLDDISDDSELEIRGFYGSEQPSDENSVMAGTADFTVDLMSFMTGTAAPKTSFETASIVAGTLDANGAQFLIATALGPFKLIVPVMGARLVADVTLGPNGVGPQFQDAKFGGSILMVDFCEALNTDIADTCSCLGLDEGLFIVDEATLKVTCADSDGGTCDENGSEAESACLNLSETCILTAGLLKGDLDTDNDDVMDAMSVGAWVSATSATITGLATE